ncbi:hypothetical protein XM38_039930 [Halomicronema hongdechloris C2206]|uniref:Uncharacterized protein n=1 Tax=Halomicronema hongdechloris C2206 TaxID=1641165 RepID=A0A1Z3HRT7_9CYAN|nr:hypothetical protein [Halomicronema hongdechloris]ASC73031.1 hypothetical protein XM38_039930 [Halomicronema hongdechloris C2206]
MAIVNPEALRERANNLGEFNGMARVLVELTPAAAPPQKPIYWCISSMTRGWPAWSRRVAADLALAKQFFMISGGHRILGGPLTDPGAGGQCDRHPCLHGVRPDRHPPLATIPPIPSASTTTPLTPSSVTCPLSFAPVALAAIVPRHGTRPAPLDEPAIDYFGQGLRQLSPCPDGGHGPAGTGLATPPGEADLDQVLLSLFSAAADELSDFQDRGDERGHLEYPAEAGVPGSPCPPDGLPLGTRATRPVAGWPLILQPGGPA